MPARPRRPRGQLAREHVLDAALRVLATEGPQALTMPRVARELDSGVMTLYSHVRDKADLLGGLAERALSEVGVPLQNQMDSTDWRGPLERWSHELRSQLLRYPGVALLLDSCDLPAPIVYDHLEASLSILYRAGLPEQTAVYMIDVLIAHVLGAVLWEVPRRMPESALAYAQRWRHDVARLSPRYQALPPATQHILDNQLDERFDLGLRSLLSGLELTLRHDLFQDGDG